MSKKYTIQAIEFFMKNNPDVEEVKTFDQLRRMSYTVPGDPGARGLAEGALDSLRGYTVENVRYAVYCMLRKDHGLMPLDQAEYLRQMDAPNSLWVCPLCKGEADWDDDTYERFLDIL